VLRPFADQPIRNGVAPTLETERLVLRHFRASDIDYFADALADPEVMRHIGGPNSREDAWRKMLTGAGFWSVTGIGMWIVDRKSDGASVGHLGFFDFQRDMQPSMAGEPEMGWIFSREGQGKGFATEGGQAALEWFEATFGPQDIPAIIAIDNVPSMKVAERLGFTRLDDGVYKDEPIAYFRRAAAA
jgi:RimJ/RimL family protein N-acetyltransferase